MKTLFILLSLSLLSVSAFASDISCTTISSGQTFYLTISIDEKAEKATVFMMNSHNASTRRGEQSMGPVGRQAFDLSKDEDSQIMSNPLEGTDYTHEREFDFTKVTLSGANNDLKVKVNGPVLNLGRLTFKDCEVINN